VTVDAQALFPTPPGDPDALDQAAGKLRGAVTDLFRLSAAYTAEAGAMARAWQSPQAATEAAGQVGALSGHATETGQRTGTVIDAVVGYAAALREAIATAKRAQAAATAADAEAARQLPPPGAGPADARGAREQYVTAAVRGQRQQYLDALADLDAKAHQCAQALGNSIPNVKPGMSPAAAAAAARANVAKDLPLLHLADLQAAGGEGPYGLGPPADPAKRAAWWAALTPDEKGTLVRAYPKRYGEMQGLPAEGRDMANRILLDQDIAELEEKVRLGLATDDDKRALAGAKAVKQQLARVQNTVDPVTGEPVPAQLLIYDPRAFGGQGRAAIVVGDLDTAQNVAVAVPGLTSDVPSYMDNLTGNALNLYGEARAAAPGESTAVVAWMGYDAPDFATVGSDDQAEAGAKLLAGDVRDIQTTRAGNPPHLTVVGHSYGSTTTGLAASKEGMRVDDLVLIGSPGAGHANTAGDLHMSGDHVYVGSNSSDTVTYRTRTAFGWDPLGQDPAGDEFGATRFQAEATDRNPAVPGIADHSKYYDPGSESLYNISSVVTGDYSDVTTAEQRDERGGWLNGKDPESERTPTKKEHALR
jgi:pimeloyl-ACP methyl ester carboxylesterase